jgi:hypothetical protein
MTITRQQVDAWDAEVNAAYERGRQEGMKQERALWTLTKVGQEIEAQPVSWTGNGSAERREINAPTGFFFQVDKRLEEDDDIQDYKKPWVGLTEDEVIDVFKEKNAIKFARAIEAALKEKNT